MKMEEIVCVGCSEPFLINRIKRHLSHKQDCKRKYSETDLNSLDTKCSEYAKRLKVKDNKERYQQNKHKIAEKYSLTENKQAKKLYDKKRNSQKRKLNGDLVKCASCQNEYVSTYFTRHLKNEESCSDFYQSNEELKGILDNLEQSNIRQIKLAKSNYVKKRAKICQERRVQQSIEFYGTQNQIKCKGCKEYFARKDIKNHVLQNKTCKKGYAFFFNFEKYNYDGPTMTCKSCKTVLPVKTFRFHLHGREVCKNKYSNKELEDMKKSSQKRKKEYQSKWYYQQKSEQRRWRRLYDNFGYFKYYKKGCYDKIYYELSMESFFKETQNISDFREFGTQDTVTQELNKIEAKIKQKIKDLKLEFFKLRKHINKVTGCWMIETPINWEFEVKRDREYVNDMIESFHYFVKDDIKNLKESIQIRLQAMSVMINYQEPTKEEKAKRLEKQFAKREDIRR